MNFDWMFAITVMVVSTCVLIAMGGIGLLLAYLVENSYNEAVIVIIAGLFVAAGISITLGFIGN